MGQAVANLEAAGVPYFVAKQPSLTLASYTDDIGGPIDEGQPRDFTRVLVWAATWEHVDCSSSGSPSQPSKVYDCTSVGLVDAQTGALLKQYEFSN
jgi:hypothetical protein